MTCESESARRLGNGMKELPLSWGTIAGVILLLLYLTYRWGSSHTQISIPKPVKTEQQTLQQLKSENSELKQQLSAMQQQIHILLEVKKNLESYLKALEQNNAQITGDLAIVNTVKGAISAENEVKIDHFKLFPTEHPKTFRYMFLVSRKTPASGFSKGIVTMTIQGQLGQKLLFLPVTYADPQFRNGLPFHCQDTQELAGELTLPDQFEPLEILFKVRTDQGGEQPQQVVAWII